MNITVDLRSLHTDQYSGVEQFTVNIVDRLLAMDPENRYTLYYNGWKRRSFERFHHINVDYKQTRIPNRILNLLLKLFGHPKIDYLAGRTDTVLMPNPIMTKVRSTTKVILVVHDLSPLLMPEMYSIKSRLWHRFIGLSKLIKRADKILAVSEFTKQTLIDKLGIPKDNISVGLLGVDHDRYHPEIEYNEQKIVRNKYGLPAKFILFIGTIEPRKNLERVIEALKLMPSDTHLVIAGKLGWKFQNVIKAMRNPAVSRRIHYLGYVPEADKPALIKLARVLIWPSLYEGFGLPILEAMSVGTPVVSSANSSIPEVAGEAALLVNPYNIDDIAEATQMFLEKPSIRQEYITKGLNRAKQFSWEKTASVLRDII